MRKRARTFLAVAVGVALLVVAGCAAQRLFTARALARASVPFEQHPGSASHRLLVVGDSTGVGTGASSPAASVAGRIGAEQPQWIIHNRSADGARFADVVSQLEAARTAGQRYDTVLVMAGGNDVIRLTGEHALAAQVTRSAELARSLAPRVVFMISGNVGNAPFFMPPLSWWMSQRSRALHAIVREVTQRRGTAYVNLYKPPEVDPFVQEAERLYAPDGLHPSDAGYALWREELRRQARL